MTNLFLEFYDNHPDMWAAALFIIAENAIRTTFNLAESKYTRAIVNNEEIAPIAAAYKNKKALHNDICEAISRELSDEVLDHIYRINYSQLKKGYHFKIDQSVKAVELHNGHGELIDMDYYDDSKYLVYWMKCAIHEHNPH